MSKSTFRLVSGSLPEDTKIFVQEEYVDLSKMAYHGNLRVRFVGEGSYAPFEDIRDAVMQNGLDNLQDNDPWIERAFEDGDLDPETEGLLTKAVAEEAVKENKIAWLTPETPEGQEYFWKVDGMQSGIDAEDAEYYNSLPVLEIERTGTAKSEQPDRNNTRNSDWVPLPEDEAILRLVFYPIARRIEPHVA